MKTFLAVAIISFTSTVVHAGGLYVRDADTIVVDGTPVRLNGVDAPELDTNSG